MNTLRMERPEDLLTQVASGQALYLCSSPYQDDEDGDTGFLAAVAFTLLPGDILAYYAMRAAPLGWREDGPDMGDWRAAQPLADGFHAYFEREGINKGAKVMRVDPDHDILCYGALDYTNGTAEMTGEPALLSQSPLREFRANGEPGPIAGVQFVVRREDGSRSVMTIEEEDGEATIRLAWPVAPEFGRVLALLSDPEEERDLSSGLLAEIGERCGFPRAAIDGGPVR